MEATVPDDCYDSFYHSPRSLQECCNHTYKLVYYLSLATKYNIQPWKAGEEPTELLQEVLGKAGCFHYFPHVGRHPKKLSDDWRGSVAPLPEWENCSNCGNAHNAGSFSARSSKCHTVDEGDDMGDYVGDYEGSYEGIYEGSYEGNYEDQDEGDTEGDTEGDETRNVT